MSTPAVTDREPAIRNAVRVIDKDAAIRNAVRIFAAASLERDRLAFEQGPLAVGRAAYVPGGPSPEERAALYISLRDASPAEQAA